jgi:hypothetical protein
MISAKSGIGVLYGRHQMDHQQVKKFIYWLLSSEYAYGGRILQRYAIGSCEFNAWWQDMEELKEFQEIQNKFMGELK